MERIRRHIIEGKRGCWLWLGALDAGHPIIRVSDPRRLIGARRYAYEQHNNLVVPKAYLVVSVCLERRCVNPAHASAQRRGFQSYKRWGFNPPTYCRRGHEWTNWNTMRQSRGQRLCRACHQTRSREKAKTRKSENAAAQRRSIARRKLAVRNLKTV
jgi:hypothetical protein